MTEADAIAAACLKAYSSLSKGKPRRGVWTVLAGIALSRPGLRDPICVSLGTGLKCLPLSRISQHGDLLHDSHAEVVARRSLILWIIHELRKPSTEWIESFGEQRWRFKPGVELHLYVSTLPCASRSSTRLRRRR